MTELSIRKQPSQIINIFSFLELFQKIFEGIKSTLQQEIRNNISEADHETYM